MASLRLAHPDGELAVARAAAAAGLGLVLSTSANTAVEAVASVPGLTTWFQLYALADRGATRALIERAAAAGARALMVTVDVPPLLPLPRRAPPDVALPEGVDWPHHGPAPQDERHLDWRYLEELMAWSPLPVTLKGILHPDDADRAAEAGAAGVAVSNHGGRVSDGVVASIDALPAVVERVAGRCEVYFDGGVRSGLDILRALALGARAVLVGRPVLWGLVLGGEAGVAAVIEDLHAELVRAAAVAGLADLVAVDATLFVRGSP
jgi:4-hydroxymandelate oxidase